MLSSVAAACSSKLNLRQKRLRKREAPGAIDPAAEGRMDDQLHAAGFVKEALQHERVLRRQAFKSGERGSQVLEQLLRGGFGDAKLADQPALCGCTGRIPAQARCYFGAQARHRSG